MKQPFSKLIALLLTVALLIGPAAPAFAAGFSDVPKDAWYAKAVQWAVDRGIAAGFGNGSFAPKQTCSRAEAVTFLWRYDGGVKPAGQSPFPDLSSAHYYADAIIWAWGRDIVKGFPDGSFRPSAKCTRAQIISMLWQYAGSPLVSSSNPFTDVDAGRYYYKAVLWAVKNGITSGMTADRFGPDEPCTRAQIVCFLYQMDKILPAKRLVVIDPGHQLHANSAREPVGPGATETKAKTSAGTYGPTSRLHEYQLNLIVSLQLRDELERRGYRVILTRETHDVDLSNIDRAQIANNAHADVMIRIHANGSTNTSVHGAMTINMTRSSPYNSALYSKSRALSEALLQSFCAATGATKRTIWDTDTMTGINWSQVPVTILEMGYMSNPQEDLRMADPAYQAKMVQGIADGLDQYFQNP